MSGDYTRFTFDHKKNYSRVLKQQGRVSLDADWNEYIEIQDRLWRSETMDIIDSRHKGRGVVPETTTDAFKITPTAIGNFSIGNGRIYVDGIQAESHGACPDEYKERLAELQGTEEYSYSDQPHYPDPLPQDLNAGELPAIVGRTDLVYLDVWQREVTYIEDTKILEKALGGADTTTRLQTVWQVKVLPKIGELGCTDDIEEWNKQIRTSAGRLTTSATGAPTDDDPCIIPPAGGYRGLENRLYRVEIHTPGGIGQAKFKWSKNNRSINSMVESISTGRKEITVKNLGRDQILRFQIDDWVEILSDLTEYKGEPGHLTRIKDIKEANRQLILETEIPDTSDFHFSTYPDNLNPHHIRVRRWDQKKGVDSSGLIEVGPGPIELKNGIQIEFEIDDAFPNGEFKVGDYWVFAARTSDGTVEELKKAMPRGIHHHYCKLAVVTWGDTLEDSKIRDCRIHWPSTGCCTVVVRPGEDIQAAIDSVPYEGGCVCFKTGVHEISEPIRIEKSNIVLHGESLGAKIICNGSTDLMIIEPRQYEEISNIAIDMLELFFKNENQEISAIIKLLRCSNVSIRNCVLKTVTSSQTIGIIVGACHNIKIEENIILDVTAGIYGYQYSDKLVIYTNDIVGRPTSKESPTFFGIKLEYHTKHSKIYHNQLTGFQSGVSIAIDSSENKIEDNHLVQKPVYPMVGIDISSHGCLVRGNNIDLGDDLSEGIRILEEGTSTRIEENLINSLSGINRPRPKYAIDVAARRCTIKGNRIFLRSPSHGGILIKGANCTVEKNEVKGTGVFDPNVFFEALNTVAGICTSILPTFDYGPGGMSYDFNLDCGAIRNNRVIGFQLSICVAWGDKIQVLDNIINSQNDYLKIGIKVGDLYNVSNIKNAAILRNQIDTTETGITTRGETICISENFINKVKIGIRSSGTNVQICKNNILIAQDFANSSSKGIDVGGMLTQLQTAIYENNVSNAYYGIDIIVLDVQAYDNNLMNGKFGIRGYARVAKISRNSIENMSDQGIRLKTIDLSRISHNRIISCGYNLKDDYADLRIGGIIIVSFGELSIECCDIIDTGFPTDGDSANEPIVALFINHCPSVPKICSIHRNNITYTDKKSSLDTKKENRLLVVHSNGENNSLIISDNRLIGYGHTALAELVDFHSVNFSNNYCKHYNAETTGIPDWELGSTIRINKCQHTNFMSNQISGQDLLFPSVEFIKPDGADITTILLGNTTSGKIKGDKNFPADKDDYNIKGLLLN